MTPKERMLTHLVQCLAIPKDLIDTRYPHVAFGPAKVGDLVICQTSGLHRWSVGYVVDINGMSGCTVREIDSSAMCNVSNESFYVVRGMEHDYAMLPEPRWRFYQKVIKAFKRLDAYMHLFGGLTFNDDGSATIKVRERYWGRHAAKVCVPYEVRVPYSRRTTIKAIAAALLAAGFGTRKFDYEEVTR